MDIPEQCCELSHREQVLKTLSPEGLVSCLQDQLNSCTDDIEFLTKKSEVLKTSIAKLQQP